MIRRFFAKLAAKYEAEEIERRESTTWRVVYVPEGEYVGLHREI